MNLLDLMEEPEAPRARAPIPCSCPDFYYPTMYVNSHIREDVMKLLDAGNVRKLAELGVRYYDETTKKWSCWTTLGLKRFKETARRFPKCKTVRE